MVDFASLFRRGLMIARSSGIRALVAIHSLAIVAFGRLLLSALAHGSGIPVGHCVLCSHWISWLRKAASGSQIICGSLQQSCMGLQLSRSDTIHSHVVGGQLLRLRLLFLQFLCAGEGLSTVAFP